MISFVQSWFAPKANPIGIDFGSETLRLAQVHTNGLEHSLFAAASADVPTFAQADWDTRLDFFAEAIPDLLAKGKFKGRSVVLSLPASLMFLQHLRVDKMEEGRLKQHIRQHAKLPIDNSNSVIRHLIAGEFSQNLSPKQEVIVIAAARDAVNKYLAAAARAKLTVVGMKVEPVALVDCYSHVHLRKNDADITSLYVDLGGSGTRAVIAQGTHIYFARSLPGSTALYNDTIAERMGVSDADARLLRLKLALAESTEGLSRDPRNVSPVPETDKDNELEQVAAAEGDVTTQIVYELMRCVCDHEATFPTKRVQRLILVGGEARHRSICLQIAREMNLPAQIGDPLVRMARTSHIPITTGIDRRLPQPAWSVAVGLSFESFHSTHVPVSSHASHSLSEGAAV